MCSSIICNIALALLNIRRNASTTEIDLDRVRVSSRASIAYNVVHIDSGSKRLGYSPNSSIRGLLVDLVLKSIPHTRYTFFSFSKRNGSHTSTMPTCAVLQMPACVGVPGPSHLGCFVLFCFVLFCFVSFRHATPIVVDAFNAQVVEVWDMHVHHHTHKKKKARFWPLGESVVGG
ncbi:unnamed protein product [Discosporangium mesarthrocarpum]